MKSLPNEKKQEFKDVVQKEFPNDKMMQEIHYSREEWLEYYNSAAKRNPQKELTK